MGSSWESCFSGSNCFQKNASCVLWCDFAICKSVVHRNRISVSVIHFMQTVFDYTFPDLTWNEIWSFVGGNIIYVCCDCFFLFDLLGTLLTPNTWRSCEVTVNIVHLHLSSRTIWWQHRCVVYVCWKIQGWRCWFLLHQVSGEDRTGTETEKSAPEIWQWQSGGYPGFRACKWSGSADRRSRP